MLLSVIGCKKDTKTIDGQWNLKSYSVQYFDLAGDKIFEDKPDELLQFSKIQIASDSISILSETKKVASQSPKKTNPASLVFFGVKKSLNTVVLNFSTAIEVNVNSFKIEKSTDGRDFIVKATLKASNVPNGQQYVFTDFNPSFGINYFRLKIIDHDGSSTYSSIVAITVNQVLIRTKEDFYFSTSLINDTFKKIRITFPRNDKMVWNDEVSNVQYIENGVTKSAAKAKLQMEYGKY